MNIKVQDLSELLRHLGGYNMSTAQLVGVLEHSDPNKELTTSGDLDGLVQNRITNAIPGTPDGTIQAPPQPQPADQDLPRQPPVIQSPAPQREEDFSKDQRGRFTHQK